MKGRREKEKRPEEDGEKKERLIKKGEKGAKEHEMIRKEHYSIP